MNTSARARGCLVSAEPVVSGACVRFLEGVDLPAILIGPDGGLIFGNSAWRAISGVDQGDPWEWVATAAEDEWDRVVREVERGLLEHRVIDVEFQARRSEAPAQVLCIALGPLIDGGEFKGLFGVARDVTERRRQEQRLAFMAGHDPLTGLANRRAFEEALGRASSLSGRDVPSVLVLLDMDHLKGYNDARGHLEGDQALVNLSLMMRSHIRASDLAARIGGDEFALLFNGASINEADEIVERICSSSLGEFVAGARAAHLGVSGGIAAVEPGVDPLVVMDRADAALYAAKNRGRHRFVKWTPELGCVELDDQISSLVSEALSNGSMSLAFQPVVDLSDGKVVYYESLIRLTTADGTQLLPAEILPVAQRLGLMYRLTRKVLDLVLRALAEVPGVSISVNLSGSDLADERLLAEIVLVLKDADVVPGRVVFEIAEDVLLADLIDARRWIEQLTALGCRFVVDDFGTGLGVFVLLGVSGIEQVKLAQTVTEALAHSQEARQFVRAVRELIESQGKRAVAAFIENSELLADAVDAGFDFGQGNSIHAPDCDLASLVARMSLTTSR